ncbi:hypothetical protein SAMN06273572_103166 [Monaibacterium marinum]|uniref:YiaAB two helix domain-containing protein n=1 Tax=Pontivivens marinum TaxID=1690039 RepID=A0A2C9CUR1_9RHOB|nr:YiaA/YiaB family inner membrane protein [Monaibacterium marinum]SOH94139.1 hypothetical protein SAMN06273572_103166 [Monaibacterium marinum]
MKNENSNSIYTLFNMLGVATAYGMLALSIWMAPVDLSTKGFWGMGVFLLTLSLVNLVKYRIDDRIQADRIRQLEAARDDKLLTDFVTDAKS